MQIGHSPPPHSLRDALDVWRSRDVLVEIDAGLDPHLEIAAHYRAHFAVSPGSPRSGDEPAVLYAGRSARMSVVMGCFGSRTRNEWLLGAQPGDGAKHLALKLGSRIAPRWCDSPPCREQRAREGLDALPVLTTTVDDAGPYLTAGIVCAGDPDRGFASVSIHRMRVLDATRLTIWILPGRDLDHLYEKALDQHRPLPVSINIGAPPAVYLTSCLSAPFVEPGKGELEAAGALLGAPVDIARCATNARAPTRAVRCRSSWATWAMRMPRCRLSRCLRCFIGARRFTRRFSGRARSNPNCSRCRPKPAWSTISRNGRVATWMFWMHITCQPAEAN